MKKALLVISLFLIGFEIFAQNINFYGDVKGKDDKAPIVGAIVKLTSGIAQQTDENGHFHFTGLQSGKYELSISIIGYGTYSRSLDLTKNSSVIIYLTPQSIALDQVIITSVDDHGELPLSGQMVRKGYFFDNNSTNFAKTLSKLPGVASLDIGTGFSKPMIRGFAFNRIAVVDKGITQQDQQWGADHGLEIDQYDVDDVMVHKGPMSLQFGSDAIGGAIEILPAKIPDQNGMNGDVTFVGKSVNDLLGTSVMTALKKDKWFTRVRYTYQRYGDYRLPANEVVYLTTPLTIYDKRLKNTAGLEQNISGLVNYTNSGLSTSLNISNVYQKTGFFPGAHGFPDPDKLKPDGSTRNIGLPYNNANHLKAIGNVTWKMTDNIKWSTDIGFQSNHRQEWSEFHDHYGSMTSPVKDPNLELDFKLNTYTFNSKLQIKSSDEWNHTIGVQSSWMTNRIKGYNFFLPRYDQYTVGGYLLSEYKMNDKTTFSGGVRYDHGNIDITGYYDQNIDKYLRDQNRYTEAEIQAYAQRAYDTDKNFGSISASLGMVHHFNKDNELKVNLGKSFRSPTAIEMGANGIHHGAFRHEMGNPDLKAEQGYQLDFSYTLHKDRFTFTLSPYASYFTNYIFLEPQGDFSILPHGGLLYNYNEAKVYFYGGEAQLHVALLHQLDLNINAQYSTNKKKSGNYSLPFTPPFTMRNELAYSGKWRVIQSYKLAIEHQYIARQGKISNYEDPTSGANLFNASLNMNILFNKFRFLVTLQGQNLLNKKYMNHLSFYRKLELPEPGRNFQLLIKIPFSI